MRSNAVKGKSVYFVGIGGIGMSALARWFLSQGWSVSGSDLEASAITEELRKEGAGIYIGHKQKNLSKRPSFIIYNRAIPSGSGKIELKAAKKLGIPTLPYADVLGAITKEYTTIAITGSHGKSTTTALAGVVLLKNRLN